MTWNFAMPQGLGFAGGYRVLTADQKEVFAGTTGAAGPTLEPGKYILEPDFDPSRAVVVDVAQGQTQMIEILAPDRIMLAVEGGNNARHVAFFPFERAYRAEVFSTRRLISRDHFGVAVPRNSKSLADLPLHLPARARGLCRP